MAMRREGDVQGELMMTWAKIPRIRRAMCFMTVSRYFLGEAGFDAFVEETCEPIYAPRMSAPSLLGRRRSRLVEREVSRFPHKERPHMPRSPTTPGQMRRSRWRARLFRLPLCRRRRRPE